MSTLNLEKIVRNETRKAVRNARKVGINISKEHQPEFYARKFALELNNKQPIRKTVRINFFEHKNGEISISVFPDDEGAGNGSIIGKKIEYQPHRLETIILPSDYQCSLFKRLFLPHIEAPRQIKSQIATAFYSKGLMGVVSAIEKNFSGTDRIKTHLLLIMTVVDHRDRYFLNKFNLYQECIVIKETFVHVMEDPFGKLYYRY